MISFNLNCDDGHEFEGWFSSSSDFEHQKEGRLLSCPVCASPHVNKSLMAPAVSTSRNREKMKELPNSQTIVTNEHDKSTEKDVALGQPKGMMPEMPVEMRHKMMEKLRDFKRQVMATAEDVGERFPEEARKIHYGETREKAIVGKASPQEVVELSEEGIDLLPLPELPEDKN